MPAKIQGPKNVTINISSMTIIKLVLVILALFFLWIIRDIVAIVFVAIILAALIDPFADWFEKHKIPRAFSVILIYIILLILLAVVLFLLIPPVVQETGEFAKDFGYYWERVTNFIDDIKGIEIGPGVSVGLEKGIESVGESLSDTVGGVFGTISGFLGGLAATIVVLVLTFYMVVEEGSAKKAYHSFAPAKYQPYLAQLSARMKKKIGYWLRGELILAFIVGFLAFIALKILGVNHALVLAITVGVAEFIPYLGPVLGAIPAIFVALAASPLKAVLVAAVFILIQQLENHLLYPKVMQKATGLNPVVSIVALLIGAKIGGAIGAVIAIPVATVLGVFIEDVQKHWGQPDESSAEINK